MASAPLHFLNAESEIDIESFFSCVLLVEPDSERATASQNFLEGYVGDITLASSGQEALNELETSFIELVIMELSLPDISGFNLLHTFQHYRPGVPIITLCSTGELEDALQAMREGAWDCLVFDNTESFGERIKNSINIAAERRLKQMQEVELRSERNAFCVAAQTAQEGLAVVGRGGVVTFTNEAFEEFCSHLGAVHTAENPVNVIELVKKHNPAVSKKLMRELREKKTGETLWSSELEISHVGEDSAGKSRNFELTLTSVGIGGSRDSSGPMMDALKRYVLWTRDVTHSKQRERFQRELISTTSHDLKGPLGTIAFAAEIINDCEYELPEEVLNLVQRIYSCARKTLDQIEQFLSARRIQDGILTVEPRWQKAEKVLSDAVLDHSMMASTKNHQLSYGVLADNLQVYADPVALHRVLCNLLSNAIKYTPEGGTIRLQAEPANNMVRISVSDTGSGIEASARHKLFECYGRLKKHQQIEGTGLGLYIANNIVKAHNGHINIESQVGKGSTFSVCLPNGPIYTETREQVSENDVSQS